MACSESLANLRTGLSSAAAAVVSVLALLEGDTCAPPATSTMRILTKLYD